jgi:dTDP-4-amino-4,6-dideoxygalactose transaminase
LKTKIEDLAIFGGKKAFSRTLHVGAPNDVKREFFLKIIDQLLETKRFTNRGPFVRELESKIARFINVKHCIVMCNATVALEIVFRALGLQKEVIVPSMTFIATAHALQWQQIKPVFCDIHPATHNIDPACIEKLITPNTTGIVGVHLWGRPCEIEKLVNIAQKHNLKLVFDAAHAFGCSYKGRMIGSFGDAEVFSFHATKFFNTFEGGAVATNNDELAEKLRLMQNFGFAGKDNVIYIGTNGKMSEISAAMGITSLESYEDIISTNFNNYRLYQQILKELPGVRLLAYDEKESCNYQYIVLEIIESKTGISRDEIMKILHAENVIARRYFYPGCHRMEPYRSYQPYASFLVPETEKMVQRVLTLPNGNSITENHINKIGQILQYVLANSKAFRNKIESVNKKSDFKSKIAQQNFISASLN